MRAGALAGLRRRVPSPPAASAAPRRHLRCTPTHRSLIQRLVVAASSALQALSDPTNADAVARLGEATGDRALRRIYHQMMQDPTGSRLLLEKPRINTKTVPAEALRLMPEGSLGRAYFAYCELHGFSADERPSVTLIDQPELAYAMTRYREIHDFLHVLTGLPPTVEGELALKTLEAVQTGLPMAALSALGGPLSLRDPGKILSWYGGAAPAVTAWAATCGQRSVPIHLLDVETWLGEPLEEARRAWGYNQPPPYALMDPETSEATAKHWEVAAGP